MRPRAIRDFDRLLRVDDEIQRDLFDFGEVGVDLSSGLHVDGEPDIRRIEIAPAKLHDLVDDVAEIDQRRRPGLLTAEAREVADDLAGAAALRLHERNLFEHRRRDPAIALEQFQRAEDRLQRVVQLVGDT